MIRPEQADQSADCYFCLTNTKVFSRRNKSKIKYPNCRSAMKPIQHSSMAPIPSTPPTGALGQDASPSQSQSSSEASVCEMFIEENEPNFPILINQPMLNDLVKELVLSKEKAEFLS